MTTSIEWTDQTWNPIVGCSRVSKGCEHCYAERVAHRGMTESHRGLTVMGKHGPRWTGEVRSLPDRLAEPLKWKKPRRVFVNSMSDLFHEGVSNEQIAAVFGVMAACPQHTFQVLTKRPERAREWFEWAEKHGAGYDLLRDGMPSALLACAWEACSGDAWGDAEPPDEWITPDAEVFGRSWPLLNVDIGVSAEDQAAADERIPHLIATRPYVGGALWVSYEPAIGPVDFTRIMLGGEEGARLSALSGITCSDAEADEVVDGGPGLDWIVIGGESGPAARPFDLAWARSTIAQCREAGVPVFVKQLGARPVEGRASNGQPFDLSRAFRDRKGGDMGEWPEDLRVRQWPEATR